MFHSKVIPIDDLLRGERLEFGSIVEGARSHPWHFAFEVFSIAMMLVGAYVTCGWAYEIGKAVGRSIG